MKISTMIISLAVVGLFITVISLFTYDASQSYGGTYNYTEFSSYNRFSELNALASDLNSSVTKVTSGSVVDVLSGFLSSGWTAIKTTFKSADILFGMIGDTTGILARTVGLGDSNTGTSISSLFTNTLLLIAIISFLFAIVSILVRSNV